MMFTLMFGTYSFPTVSFTVEGFPIDMNIQENLIPRADGAMIRSQMKPRVFNVTGKIYEANQAAAITDLLSMQTALIAAGECQFFYRSDRYINAFVKSITPKPVLGTDQAVMDVDIAFEAQDPYFYAAGLAFGGSLAMIIVVWAVLAFRINPGVSGNLVASLLVVVFSFLFVTVSARIVGLIGASANPISGMTIATLMVTALLFVGAGWTAGAYPAVAILIRRHRVHCRRGGRSNFAIAEGRFPGGSDSATGGNGHDRGSLHVGPGDRIHAGAAQPGVHAD